MKIAMILSFLLISCSSYTQDTCHRATREGYEFLLGKIPPTFCMPPGTVLFDTHPSTDMNADGLPDMAIRFLKEGFSDGDTLFTGVYFMNQDSSFSFIKKLGKLDVLYFKHQSSDYFSKMRQKTVNNYLYNELAGAHGYDPKNETTFDGDKIKISMEPGVGLKYYFEYTYDPSIQNWKQTKYVIDDEFQEPKIQSVEIDDPAPLITEFNITDYM